MGGLLFDGFSVLFSCVIELVKAKISIKIAECNSIITKLSTEESHTARLIGFEVETEGDCDYDEFTDD